MYMNTNYMTASRGI